MIPVPSHVPILPVSPPKLMISLIICVYIHMYADICVYICVIHTNVYMTK